MGKPKVFVSYSTKDISWVRQFVDALIAHDVDVWFDAYRVPLGRPLQGEMERGFRESDFLVILVTPDLIQTPQIFFGLGAAAGMGKTIVPVVPREMDLAQLPEPLRVRQIVIRTSPKETAKHLAAQLKPEPATV